MKLQHSNFMPELFDRKPVLIKCTKQREYCFCEVNHYVHKPIETRTAVIVNQQFGTRNEHSRCIISDSHSGVQSYRETSFNI